MKRIVSLSLLLLLSILHSTSHAQPVHWSDPINISNTPGWSSPNDMSIAPDGNIHVVWADDSRLGDPWMDDILYVHSDGNRWTDPVQISPFDTTWSANAQIAVDHSGSPHVIWNHNMNHPGLCVYYSTMQDSVWTDPIDLSQAIGAPGGHTIAIDSQNNIHVIISGYNPGSYDIFHKIYNGEEWLPIELIIDTDSHSTEPVMVIDSEDNLHLTWEEGLFPEDEIYYSKCDNDTWSHPVNISRTDTSFSLEQSLDLDSNNNPHIVWKQLVQYNPVVEDIFYSHLDDGNWSEPENITDLEERCDYPKLAVFDQDDMFLNYKLSYGNEDFYVCFSYNLDSLWSQPDTLMPEYISTQSDILVDDEGIVHTIISAIEIYVSSNVMYMKTNDFVSVTKESNYKASQQNIFDIAPNPFNHSTNISYNIINKSEVKINLYNIQGQLLSVLADDLFSAGEYHVFWDGRNQLGTPLGSGTYLLLFQINGESYIRRVNLIK